MALDEFEFTDEFQWLEGDSEIAMCYRYRAMSLPASGFHGEPINICVCRTSQPPPATHRIWWEIENSTLYKFVTIGYQVFFDLESQTFRPQSNNKRGHAAAPPWPDFIERQKLSGWETKIRLLALDAFRRFTESHPA